MFCNTVAKLGEELMTPHIPAMLEYLTSVIPSLKSRLNKSDTTRELAIMARYVIMFLFEHIKQIHICTYIQKIFSRTLARHSQVHLSTVFRNEVN